MFERNYEIPQIFCTVLQLETMYSISLPQGHIKWSNFKDFFLKRDKNELMIILPLTIKLNFLELESLVKYTSKMVLTLKY